MTFHEVQTEEEARAVSGLAVEVFGVASRIIVPTKPKWALFARDDSGAIAGGVILKRVGDSTGFVDWIFVSERNRGQGLGSQLLDRGIRALDEAGCTTQFALVRDDNTPSWSMFARRRYKVPSLFKVLFGYSLQATGYLLLLLFAMTGYSMWVRTPDTAKDGEMEPVPDPWLTSRSGFLLSLVFTVLVTAVIGRFGALGTQWLAWAIGYFTTTSVVRVLLMFPFARRFGPVRFQIPHGGAVISVIQAAWGSWWPHFGFWAPRDPLWRVSDFRKYEGASALAGWFVTIAATLASGLVPVAQIADGLRSLMIIVLVFQAIPFVPFEGMDGFRVMQWSRVAWIVGVLASVATVVFS